MHAGGAACILCGVLWDGYQVAAAVACKAGVSAVLALCPLYTEELFPSNVQVAVLNACKLVSHPSANLAWQLCLHTQCSWLCFGLREVCGHAMLRNAQQMPEQN